MNRNTQTETDASHIFIYQRTLSPLLAALLAVPLLFVFLSMAAALLAGGAVAAVLLPLVFRGRLKRVRRDAETIELTSDQYLRVDDDVRQLPPR